jgi:NAD(P)-dependent dehydrogenase (short-subunit alcohol dehydrogenase family)
MSGPSSGQPSGFTIAGKAAAVTGGASGIGKALSAALVAADAADAAVAVIDLHAAAAEAVATEHSGTGKVIGLGADVGDGH